MSIDTPIRDTASTASKSVDRRTLLKAGVWAAPVLVLTTAAPAQAASGIPAQGTLTLTAGSGAQSNGNIVWTGGRIAYQAPASPNAVDPAICTYTVTAARTNGGSTITLGTGAVTVASGSSKDLASLSYSTTGLANGSWRITLTVTTTGTSAVAQTANFSIANK